MGISQIGVSSTVIDTSLAPKLTFANRYSWSTAGGSTSHGAMTYRSADNSLYKLDNIDTTSQTFEKWSLSTNSAASLQRIQGSSNGSPVSRPQLVTGYDGNIYCQPNTANLTTYSWGVNRYNVSANTWGDTGVSGITYTQSIALLPPIPSHFTNSSDTLVIRGNLGSTASNSQAISNVNGSSQGTGAFDYDTSSNQIVSQNHCEYVEFRDGHDKNPTGIIVTNQPHQLSTMNRMAIGTVVYGNSGTDSRGTGFARMLYQNTVPYQFNSANLAWHIKYGGNDGNFQKPICIESRWLLLGSQNGWLLFDIFNGAIVPSPKMHIPSGTNPVYISSTKKLYFHATDNFLYEYNVTFGS